MFEHSIHDGKQLAHAGGDNDLGGFSSLREQQFTFQLFWHVETLPRRRFRPKQSNFAQKY